MTTRRHFLQLASGTAVAALFPARAADPAPGAELAVMTYNLRYGSVSGPEAWSRRRPLIGQVFQQYAPDVLGTQEGLYWQLKDLAADQGAYDWIGHGRDGGSRGEFMAVYFRRERLEPMEYEHFWLSDTPEVIGSSTWGNTNRRMVTWVRFKDRRTGREFHFWNTHLDHALQPAREKGAELILKRLGRVPAALPVLLVGDFNAEARNNPAYDLLTGGGLTDTWYAAGERRQEDANSFNGFQPLRREGRRIDWILGRGLASVRAAEVVTLQPGGQFPSDHCPVAAWLTLA
ncbi:MAG: endonuclease/exonuclease/phosphatase family protein [Verrucomicrobiota bacterium]